MIPITIDLNTQSIIDVVNNLETEGKDISDYILIFTKKQFDLLEKIYRCVSIDYDLPVPKLIKKDVSRTGYIFGLQFKVEDDNNE